MAFQRQQTAEGAQGELMVKASRIFVLAFAIPGLAMAQKVADFAKVGPAAPFVPNASEDTPINYAGGEPPAFPGALDADDSTHNRPVTCAALSGVGTATAFDTVTITAVGVNPANITIFTSLVGGGACPNANDTFMAVYNGTFNPASALTNCLAVNDDISGATNRCSTLTFTIPVGETRVVAISGFNNPPTGLFAYQVNFTGTTPVELMGIQIE
jgi:hypothetical protein